MPRTELFSNKKKKFQETNLFAMETLPQYAQQLWHLF